MGRAGALPAKNRIVGGNEAGKLVREYDWAATGLGPIGSWPAQLVGVANAILNSPLAFVLMCGPDNNLIYNDSYAVFAGKRHPSIFGLPVVKAWPEIVDYNLDIIRKVKNGKTIAYQDQLLVLDRRGHLENVYVDLNYGPIFDDDGLFYGVQVSVIETTERIQAIAAKERSESDAVKQRRQLLAMFNDAPAYIAIMAGPYHMYEFVNASYTQLIGGRDVVGKTINQALPELKGQGIYEVLDQVYESGEPFVGTEAELMIDRQGHGRPEQIYLNFTCQPRRDESGDINGIFIYASDVTALVRARHKAEKVLALKQTITDNSSTALFVLDPKGICTFMNPAAERMTNLSYTKVVGRRHLIDDILHCSHTFGSKEGCQLHRAVTVGKEYTGQEELVNNSNNKFQASFSVNHIIGDSHAGMVMEIRDVSEAHAAQQRQERFGQLTRERTQLMKLNKSKDEFIGMASHQLRTPATAVKQYISLLVGGFSGELNALQSTYARQAFESNERQLQIINDMLKIAQLDASRYSLRPEYSSVVELLKRVTNEIKESVYTRKQKLNITHALPDLKIYIDPAEVNLVLVNILENASKYSAHETTIRLNVAVRGGWVIFTIRDEGVGIAAEDRRKIFQKFTRVDNELSDTVSGSGLGLYLAQQIIKMHNGTIAVRSRLGKGSTFTVKLPYERPGK